MAVGTASIIAGAVLYIRQPKLLRIAPDHRAASTGSSPSSAKLTPLFVANYSVPPSNPKYISIPAIHITNTPVVQLGLQAGVIATPDNVYEVGWYAGSSLPGQSGAAFMYGHVSSWTAKGVFYNLRKLVAGDKIVVTRGDDTTFEYQVVSAKTFPADNVNMAEVLAPISPDKPGLNLMTCTGRVISGTSEFSERLVVFAKLL